MFGKMKECCDAIKRMMVFEKSATIEAVLSNDANWNDRSNFYAATEAPAFNNGAPCSRIERTLIRTSTLNSSEMRELNAMLESIDETCSNGSNSCLEDTMNSSLRSFLALEKRVIEKFSEEDATEAIAEATAACSIKKKISAEPFLSYTQRSPKFIWLDDSDSEKICSSFECSNSSDIAFEHPKTSSTFCEYSYSPVQQCGLQDSGFDTNYSI